MDKMNDLKELLRHDIQMLHSVELQIIEAMPVMIKAAQDPALKQALEEHLAITKIQHERIHQIRRMIGADEDSVEKHTGILAKLMGKGTTCKAMEGIISENQKVVAENLSAEVRDAAIVAGNQKIEHFEIASYGTARTYALQLGLHSVAQLLQQTLDEEHRADEILTKLAIGSINEQAEAGASVSA
jgi:ferritin-like metal-binding protein YciE